jgi:hypothetical protein
MSDNLKAAAYAAGLSGKDLDNINNFSKQLKVHRELSNLDPDVANNVYNKLSPAQQQSLKQTFGTTSPLDQKPKGWLGTAWHYTMAGLQNVSDFSTRVYRTVAIAGMEQRNIADAWKEANDKGDLKFNPGRIDAARAKYGVAAINVALKIAEGKPLGQIAKETEGNPEESKWVRLADKNQGTVAGVDQKTLKAEQDLFQDALDAVQAAKYSPGRQVANALLPGQLEGSGFFYKAVSGAVDAAYRIFADPLLVAGKVKKLLDVKNYALDVLVGSLEKGNVDKVEEVFKNKNVVNFWNEYGKGLDALKQARTADNQLAAVEAANRLKALAPEFGPEVIKDLLNATVPVTDALTAKAYFQNADQVVNIMKGQAGRSRALMPRLDARRQIRVNAVTMTNKIFDVDKMGPKFIDDYFFGGDTTTDGIIKTLQEGRESIVNQVKAGTNPKDIARMPTAYINSRIDKFKQKFTSIPYGALEGLNVKAADASTQVYRIARLALPQREAKLIAQAFESTDDVGKRKDIYYGVWATIADIRGIKYSQGGQEVARAASGKGIAKFADEVDGYNPSVLPGTNESVALIASDISDFVSAPSIRDIDRLTARSGWIQRAMGLSHNKWVETMTSAWSFLTLAGPRYALRNATEDLMVGLAIGKNPWGLVKGRMMSTRLRTVRQTPEGLTKFEKVAAQPLGAALRMLNKADAESYYAELDNLPQVIKKAQSDITELNKIVKANQDPRAVQIAKDQIALLSKKTEGGLINQQRLVLARALNEGKVNRFLKMTGLGKLTENDRKLLAKQIMNGDLDNALRDVVEGGKQAFSGLDYTARALYDTRKNGVRTTALKFRDMPTDLRPAKGSRGLKRLAPLADTSTQVAWMLRIRYYANDQIGGIALANMGDRKKAVEGIMDYLEKNPELAKSFRWADPYDHANRVYDSAKQIVSKADGEINYDLLNKIRVFDDETQKYAISGELGLDDLPTDEALAPKYILGPQLVPVTDTGNYTTSLMQWGWDWLGEANARLSREPMVLATMVNIRRNFEKSGFEQAFIKAHLRGIDPADTNKITEATAFAERKLAEIVEDRARMNVLQYVDNPMVQSQFAWSIRNFARFYRATEDFYRRIYRTVRFNPESVQKAALTYEGITHSGWVQEDDNGEPYFVYPAIAPVYRAVQFMMQGLGVDAEFKTPMPVEFGARLNMITPSLNPDSLLPTFAGPAAAIPLKVISNIVDIFNPGAADTITQYTMGKYAVDQPMLSAFLPAHVNRIYAALNKDERDGQYASAMRKAVTYLEAAGYGLQQRYTKNELGEEVPVPFTAKELEDYRVRLKNTTMSILGLRVVYGFVAPASPQVQLKSEMSEWVRDNKASNFKQAWYNLLDKYPGDYDAAMARWVELFPDQIPFTVSESDRSTVAYFRYAEESGKFVDENGSLFDNYKQGASFLIPHKAGYSWDAYKTMTDMGLRQNKRVSDFLREVQTAADLQTYYSRKDTYEKSLSEVVTDFERTQLRQEFNDWARTFKAGRPLVQEELAQGGARAIERQNALTDLRNMLQDKTAMSKLSSQKDTVKYLTEMVKTYDTFIENKKQYEYFTSGSFLTQLEKDEAIAKLRKLSEYNENTRSAYNVLFSRLIGD